jgi:hypothetical protein
MNINDTAPDRLKQRTLVAPGGDAKHSTSWVDFADNQHPRRVKEKRCQAASNRVSTFVHLIDARVVSV